MDQVNLSVYDREADRLETKLQKLLTDIEEFRFEPVEQLTPINPFHDTSVDNLWLAVSEDDMLQVDEDWLGHENSWLYDKSERPTENRTGNVCLLEPDGNDVDVSNVIRSLKESTIRQLPFPISTRTFARPKKGRSSLGSIVISTPGAVQVGSPKLRRRLTTTIDPSPALIPHLEQLSRTNNRPLSSCDDLNWEDGAAEGEALAEHVNLTPKRPTVPASLLQRLQELKETNNVQSPFINRVPSNPMSVSQLMRDIPDWENAEPESYLSLGDASMLSLTDTENMKHMMDSMDRRLTFGGVILPPGRPLADLNKTFAMPDPLIEVSEHNSTFSKDDESKLYITNPVYDGAHEDENRNTEELKTEPLKGYSSKLFDKTFANALEQNQDGVELTFEAGKKLNGTFEKVKIEEKEERSYHYSTATYSRPAARFSPARSGLPMRRASPAGHASTEDLARSPARSDGTITPVDLKPTLGTYTRNSPVERNGSEDEQMSTASDHSGRSHDSIEDIPNRFKSNGTTGKRQISTPRTSTDNIGLEDWHMSPISRNQMTPARSIERLGAARVLNRLPHGPMPMKPALIRPTENFKRPVVKKNDVCSTFGKTPLKPTALLTGASGLPKPASRGLPTRIPAGRLSSIPRPPPSRLGTTINKSNS